MRATSREAARVGGEVQLGLHVRRAGWAARAPRRLDRASVGVGGVSASGLRELRARRDAAQGHWASAALLRRGDAGPGTLLT